jgi:hypothetical protein
MVQALDAQYVFATGLEEMSRQAADLQQTCGPVRSRVIQSDKMAHPQNILFTFTLVRVARAMGSQRSGLLTHPFSARIAVTSPKWSTKRSVAACKRGVRNGESRSTMDKT